MVLVKRIDERGFCFFTNAESSKGTQLAHNPKAALCFHWKSLRRQLRVEGEVTELAGNDVDTYFHSRSRRSQIGAAVSQQSRPLASRSALEEQVSQFAGQHPGEASASHPTTSSSGWTALTACMTAFSSHAKQTAGLERASTHKPLFETR
jgi:pyridoxine/pyridoxamine 5'-phosphate oxidase